MMGAHPFHVVGEKYIVAVRDGAKALPLLIPSLDPPLATSEILSNVSGLLFTGSVSNVSPKLYGGAPPREGVLQDERRDATTIPLLKAAIAAGIPTLCLCRGFQELNVVYGGTLYQHVQEVPGRLDHREDLTQPLEVQYGPAHDVTVEAGGLLAKTVHKTTFKVNSLHSQGVNRLAAGLHVEAVAPDGQIEAVSMPSAKGFLLGVQWHPEWRWWENPISRAIFAAFGEAVRARVPEKVR
jgi:putative glutamine amidotransferase